MHPITDYFPTALLVAASVVIPGETEKSIQEIEIENLDDLVAAQAFVDEGAENSPSEIVLTIRPGDYLLEESFHIARSNVRLEAEPGARFILADEANCPVVAIGTQNEWVDESDVIENISVSGLEIDGNKDYQSSELDTDRPWIRNNGIDARGVRNLKVRNVVAKNNRSGGLVISWKCSDVDVRDSLFSENYFDGVAYYDSIRVFTTNCVMRDNQFAGVSLDNRLLETYFSECLIESNGNVGVFARNTIDLYFDDCVIRDSADWAVFLAHDEKELGVHGTEIRHCLIEGNRGGIFMASVKAEQSSGTVVKHTRFIENGRDGRLDIETSGSAIESSQNAFGKDLALANEPVRNDPS